MTNLEAKKREQNNIKTYFESVTPQSKVIFNIILGERDIGKTYFILKNMVKAAAEKDSMFLILVRKIPHVRRMAEGIVNAYGPHFSEEGWKLGTHNKIIDIESGRVIGMVAALNDFENLKGVPLERAVSDIFFDECYSFTPVTNEWSKLRVIIPTVAREIGKDDNEKNVTVWTAGNEDMGASPIIEGLNLDVSENKSYGHAIINENGSTTIIGYRMFNSRLKSPDGVFNVAYSFVKPTKVNNEAIITWKYAGRCYGLYQVTNRLHIKPISTNAPALSTGTIRVISTLAMAQPDISMPLTAENGKCLHLHQYLKGVWQI